MRWHIIIRELVTNHNFKVNFMQIKHSLIIIVCLLALQTGVAQEINWKNTRNWKLYNIYNQAGARYSLDTLQHFKSTVLNSDTMQSFLDGVTAWPPEKYSMWMGLFIVTCETEDKKPRKIIVSTYGGFFYDQITKRYYQIEPALASQWLEFLNDAGRRISGNN